MHPQPSKTAKNELCKSKYPIFCILSDTATKALELTAAMLLTQKPITDTDLMGLMLDLRSKYSKYRLIN
jgi:hypothetical protein